MPKKVPQRTCMGCQAKKDNGSWYELFARRRVKFPLISPGKSRAGALISVRIWNA